MSSRGSEIVSPIKIRCRHRNRLVRANLADLSSRLDRHKRGNSHMASHRVSGSNRHHSRERNFPLPTLLNRQRKGIRILLPGEFRQNGTVVRAGVRAVGLAV